MAGLVYRLGMLGFDAVVNAHVKALLEQAPSAPRPHWVVGDWVHADALIVADATQLMRARERALPSAVLCVSAGLEIATPLTQCLDDLEARLKPLARRFSLARIIHQRCLDEAGADAGLWHVFDVHAELIAVVDFDRMTAAIHPQALLCHFSTCSFQRRPMSAFAPLFYEEHSLVDLMWDFARRSREALLPAQLGTVPLTLRKQANPLAQAFWPNELTVLDALRAQPANIDQLQCMTLLPLHELGRVVAALYFAGAIQTLDRRSAIRRHLSQWLGRDPHPDGSSQMFGSRRSDPN